MFSDQTNNCLTHYVIWRNSYFSWRYVNPYALGLRVKTILTVVFIAIPLFLLGYSSIFLVARYEFVAGPSFRSTETYFLGIYLITVVSAMILNYIIATVKSIAHNINSKKLITGGSLLWITFALGYYILTLRYTALPPPVQGGLPPENPFILFSWVVLLTLDMITSLMLLFFKSKSKLERKLELSGS